MIFLCGFAGSSNGRTHASGAWYRGSSPCPAAFISQSSLGGFCGIMTLTRERTLLCVRAGLEDRSVMRAVASIARGGLRADRVTDEGGLVGESLPGSVYIAGASFWGF